MKQKNGAYIVLGAGIEQEYLYELLKKNNIKIITVDKNSNAHCIKYSDFYICHSIKNYKNLYNILKKKLIKYNLKPLSIMTIATDNPVSISYLCRKFNLASISLNSAKKVSNKILMKKEFKKKNIPTSKFFTFNSKKKFEKFYQHQKKDLIIKPSNSSGSRGVFLLNSNYDKKKINSYFDKSLQYSSEKTKRVIVEEYLEGPQISAEGIFYKDKFYLIALSDRNYKTTKYLLPNIIEDGGELPSKFENKFRKKIERLIFNAAKSLEISWGPIKADIVINNNKPYIIELAARISGGYFATNTIRFSYKYDIVKNYIKLSNNKKIDKPVILKKPKTIAQRYIFASPGKIKSININQKILKRQFVKKVVLNLSSGNYQKKIRSHPDRTGMVICSGNTISNAIKNCHKTINNILINYYAK